MTFPEPTGPSAPRTEVFLDYIGYFRERIAEKIGELPEDSLSISLLPSGWTPLQLLKHLRLFEMRWLEWGFEGSIVDEPWGDHQGERWHTDSSDSRLSLTAELRGQGRRSDEIVRSHSLDEHGKPGPRWDGAEPPALERVLFHLLQEYARHMGHLDIVVEMTNEEIGE
jgi:uncharacterized damage-inducible protein DinB